MFPTVDVQAPDGLNAPPADYYPSTRVEREACSQDSIRRELRAAGLL